MRLVLPFVMGTVGTVGVLWGSRGVLLILQRKIAVDGSQPVVLTCGSGLTACILALAMHQAGTVWS